MRKVPRADPWVDGAPDPGTSSAPKPYRKGWRAPWRGQWGGFGDGHSSLSQLSRKIERQLRQRYEIGEDPVSRLLVRQAARQAALAEALADKVCIEDNTVGQRSVLKRLHGSTEGVRRVITLLEARHAPRQTRPEDLVRELRDRGGERS